MPRELQPRGAREYEGLIDLVIRDAPEEDRKVEAVLVIDGGFSVRRYYVTREGCPVRQVAYFHDAIALRRYWWLRAHRVLPMHLLRSPEHWWPVCLEVERQRRNRAGDGG